MLDKQRKMLSNKVYLTDVTLIEGKMHKKKLAMRNFFKQYRLFILLLSLGKIIEKDIFKVPRRK